jgi:peptidyl-prolyl cis-trans isomerase SurA
MKRIAGFLLTILVISNACQKPPTSTVLDVKETPALSQESVEPVVLSVGKVELTKYLLEKDLEVYTITDSISFDSAMNDLVFRKRVYIDAQNKGYGQGVDDKEEIATYQALLAKDYLIDSTLLNKMINEAYEHLKEEINASHIFIAFSPDSEPSDSSFIINDLIRIRDIALEKNAFDSLAKVFSQDKRTALKGGNLGWFSALQMYYPIEKSAYSLNKGEISKPIRSSKGYHLVKLNSRRPSQGTVTVRHILKAVPDWNNIVHVMAQKSAIDSLHALLVSGGDFEEFVANDSDDKVYATQGGLLPSFSIGTRAEVEFEKAAFDLKKNEYSNVVKTSVGFHIIQLVERTSLPPKEKMWDYIKNKVITDSRGDFLEESMLLNKKNKLNYQLYSSTFQTILNIVDAEILEGIWKNPTPESLDLLLIKLNGKEILAKEFIDFMIDRQTYDPSPQGYSPKMAVRRYFKIFETNLINKEAEMMSPTWNPELSQQIQQLKESLITTEFLNDFIFEKSVSDTLSQRRYYELNKERYTRNARRYAIVIKGNDNAFIEKVKSEFEAEKPYRLKRGIYPIYFSRNDYFLSEEDKVRLNGLVALLDKNEDYIVEVGGHVDVAEEDYVSSTRIKTVVNYLTEAGLPITRIQEFDYTKTRLADRFDWSKNQRVSIQFFSKNEFDLLPSLDSEKKHLLSVERKWFDQSNENVWKVNLGESAVFKDSENVFSYYKIIKEQESGYLTFRESKAKVIKDYQTQLEANLRIELEKKYPVSSDVDSIRFLKEKLILQN